MDNRVADTGAPIVFPDSRDGTRTEAPSVVLGFRPTSGDYVRVVGDLARRSAVSIAMAGFFATDGAVLIWYGDLWGIVFVALGLAFLAGFSSVPFVLFAISRRRDLMLTDIHVEADPDGLTMANRFASSRQAWGFYRTWRETREAFLLQPGTGATVFILKRGATDEQLAAFRGVVASAGLRPRNTGLLRLLVAGAAGCAVAVALTFGGQVAARIGANASVSMTASVQGPTTEVAGSTDLPEGSTVVIQLIQLDEYDRAVAAGAAPDPSTSPWILENDVTVAGGHFSTTFRTGTWPSGRAVATAYFWMFPGQPQAAIDRFGPDGSALKGPDVVQTDDRGRMLQVDTSFRIP